MTAVGSAVGLALKLGLHIVSSVVATGTKDNSKEWDHSTVMCQLGLFNLAQVKSSRKKDPQLRKWFYQIGWQASPWDMFLIND